MTIGELGTVVIAICTAVYTVGTLLLWFTTKRTANLIEQQISLLNATGRSSAWHSLIDGHRDLYLQLITNENLLKLYSKESGLSVAQVRKKYLATLMINQALRIYLDYDNELHIPGDSEGFIRDLHSIMQFKFVKERWTEIKGYYPPSFREFIDRLEVPENA